MYNRPHPSKKIILHFLLFIALFLEGSKCSLASVPRPDHVVICILENHSYNQIVGSTAAPYINSLVPESANLKEFYGLSHPSQPNYLMMFSGANQGETTDNLPSGTPWTTKNLGSSLLYTGYTFASYSEGLPSQGSTVGTSGSYARKHCPWVNWQGTGTNQIPASCNKSMNDFPTNFSHLPDLSYVIPNQNNDMHNGSDPARITTGDSWVKTNLKAYIDWAKQNNSLLILTFDEDNFTPTNHIMCLFIGQMVQNGSYAANTYNHYDLLRTLEDMFTLPHAGNAATATPIEEIWKSTSVGITSISDINFAGVYPNPVTDYSQIVFENKNRDQNNKEIHLVISDIAGRIKSDEVVTLLPGRNNYAFRREGFSSGLYTFMLLDENAVIGKGKLIVN